MTFLIMRLSCLQKQHVDDTAKFSGQRGLDTDPSLEPQLQKLQCTEAAKSLGQMFVLGTKKKPFDFSCHKLYAQPGEAFPSEYLLSQCRARLKLVLFISLKPQPFPSRCLYGSLCFLPSSSSPSSTLSPFALPVAFLYVSLRQSNQ